MCKTVEDYAQDREMKGRAECHAEGRAEDVERMLRNGKTPEEIADFCGFPLEYVEGIEAGMLSKA